MRVNLTARIPMHLHRDFSNVPLVLTIETAHGIQARCEHRTTTSELLQTLDRGAEIDSAALDRFRQKLKRIEEANLSDVEVSDEALSVFGFFV